MRKKISQVMLFVLIVSLGLVCLNSLLNAKVYWCGCVNTDGVEHECDVMCMGYGGCLYIWPQWDFCYCNGMDCNCSFIYECESGHRGWTFRVYTGCPICL